jgi:hypothetical protein
MESSFRDEICRKQLPQALATVPPFLAAEVESNSLSSRKLTLGTSRYRIPRSGLVQAPFALLDSNDHPFVIDIGDFQADSLGDAQSGSVANRQDRAMLDALDTA